MKNTLTSYSLSLYLIILSIFFSPPRSSQINAKIRKVRKKNMMSVVYANDAELRGVCLTILAKNQIFLNKAKWDEIRKYYSKGNNEHGPKN